VIVVREGTSDFEYGVGAGLGFEYRAVCCAACQFDDYQFELWFN